MLADAQTIFPRAAESTLTDLIVRVQQASTTVGIVALISSLWVSASFWGALDTAFCRIYHLPCRTWVRQKLFGFGMLVVVLVFIAASVIVPTVQSLLVTGAQDLPFGLGDQRDLVYWATIALGLVILFVALCITYFGGAQGRDPVGLRVAGGAGGDDRRRHPRLRVPGLPVDDLDAADRHQRGLRADRAGVVLRAGADRARRRGDQ